MKNDFPALLGNRDLRERFRDDILSGTLAHAYILEGQSGSGKHLFARQFAAALSCENKDRGDLPLPCGECPTCRKILSGNSPDLRFIGRKSDKATIGVETIRDLRLDTAMAPNDLDVKLYVIEEAQLLTIQAQNALLLTLEEPPAYVRFLLLCETSAPLLETIKSRAPIFRMEPLTKETLAKELPRLSPEASSLAKNDPTAFAELLAAADGSMGRALSFFEGGTQKNVLAGRELTRRFLSLVSSQKNAAKALEFLALCPQKRDALTEQIGEFLLALSDLAAIKKVDRARLCFFADANEAEEIAMALSLPRILKLEDLLQELSETIQKNANTRLALTAFAADAKLL